MRFSPVKIEDDLWQKELLEHNKVRLPYKKDADIHIHMVLGDHGWYALVKLTVPKGVKTYRRKILYKTDQFEYRVQAAREAAAYVKMFLWGVDSAIR